MERAPIIVVMGHIDHGKSTLLDYIRKSNVVEGEAGGITQHVSAYEISHKGKPITFIDTPGHEAVSSMREKGVAAADIAILVVSAEDGVKPQTLEARNAIEKNKLPYVVAINKIDKPNANVEKAKNTLVENSIYIEGMGGEVPWSAISAKTGQGVPELLDLLLLVAEVAELKQDKSKPAAGVILESKLDPRKGVSATVIVRDGTLRRGDYLVTAAQVEAESDCFRIKKLENFRGEDVAELGPAQPGVVSGWNEVPPAGSPWQTCDTKGSAEKISSAANEGRPAAAGRVATEAAGDEKLVPIVLKADTAGTLEALKKEVLKIALTGVKLQITEAGIGAISESDIKLVSAKPEALIVGFHVKVEKSAGDLASKYNLNPTTFDIIYKLSEWLEQELIKRRPVVEVETIVGTAKVVRLFSQAKTKQIVGALATEGEITPRKPVRVKRREAILGVGEVIELREQQNVVPAVAKGKQFGALIESRIAIAVGDILEVFQIEKK
ncbi:MAG: translation initiation factor IF-2 [Patescibacteria group bacterium]